MDTKNDKTEFPTEETQSCYAPGDASVTEPSRRRGGKSGLAWLLLLVFVGMSGATMHYRALAKKYEAKAEESEKAVQASLPKSLPIPKLGPGVDKPSVDAVLSLMSAMTKTRSGYSFREVSCDRYGVCRAWYKETEEAASASEFVKSPMPGEIPRVSWTDVSTIYTETDLTKSVRMVELAPWAVSDGPLSIAVLKQDIQRQTGVPLEVKVTGSSNDTFLLQVSSNTPAKILEVAKLIPAGAWFTAWTVRDKKEFRTTANFYVRVQRGLPSDSPTRHQGQV